MRRPASIAAGAVAVLLPVVLVGPASGPVAAAEPGVAAASGPAGFGFDVDCTGPAITVTYWEEVWAAGDRGAVAMSAEAPAGDPWRAPDAAVVEHVTTGTGYEVALATYPSPSDGRVLAEGDKIVVGRRPVGGEEYRTYTTVRCDDRPRYATQRAAVSDGYLFVSAESRNNGLVVKARSESTNEWTGWVHRRYGNGQTTSALGMAAEAGTTEPRFDWLFVANEPYSAARRKPSAHWDPGWSSSYWGRGYEFDPTSGVSLLGSRGNIFAAALGSTGHMWVIRLDPHDAGTAGPWVSIGRPSGVDLVGDPTSVASDGKLFFGALGSDRGLWVRTRSATSASWSRWVGLGHPAGVDLVGTPNAVVSDGYLFLAALGEDGRVYTRSRNERTDAWSGWISRGRPAASTLAGAPELVVSDGRMFLVLHGSDGHLYLRARSASSNAWTSWTDLGRPSSRLVGSITGVESDGKLFLFGLDEAGDLVCRARSVSTNAWTGWVNLGSSKGVLDG